MHITWQYSLSFSLIQHTQKKKKLIMKGDFYKKDSGVSISKRETNYLLQVCVL